MMKKGLSVGVIFLVMVIGTMVSAQEFEGGIKQGMKEIAIVGMVIMPPGGDSFWNATGTLGLFATKQLEVGASLSLSGSGSDTTGGIGGFLKYHFVKDIPTRGIPYIGAMFQSYKSSSSGGGSESISIYGGSAGYKYFTSEKSGFFAEYNYLTSSDAGGEGVGIIFAGVYTLF